MEENKVDGLDINKLNQRDLIVLMHYQVSELKEELKGYRKDVEQLKMDNAILKTKMQIWSAAAGAIAAAASSLITYLITGK